MWTRGTAVKELSQSSQQLDESHLKCLNFLQNVAVFRKDLNTSPDTITVGSWTSSVLFFLYFSRSPSSSQKDELDDIPIELSKVQSVKVRSHAVIDPREPDSAIRSCYGALCENLFLVKGGRQEASWSRPAAGLRDLHGQQDVRAESSGREARGGVAAVHQRGRGSGQREGEQRGHHLPVRATLLATHAMNMCTEKTTTHCQ